MILKNIFLLIIISLFILQCDLPEAADETPPSVNLVYPNAESIITEDFRVVVEASDNDKIESVWAYIDDVKLSSNPSNTNEFDVDFETYNDNIPHTIKAYAIDKSGNSAIPDEVTLYIGETPDISPPTLFISYPINNTTVSGSVNIIADINDNRTVTKAEFYINGVLESTDTNGADGWSATWVADSTFRGQNSIYAKGFDASNVGISAQIIVTVL